MSTTTPERATLPALNDYRLLGRSGLRVSPMCLGVMKFGTGWGSGAEMPESRRILDYYVERGGNFVDTANIYEAGQSEEFLGQLIQGRRDQLVVATKYSLLYQSDNPNAGGNQRKSMMRSVEQSLRRLRTDYIDLLYLHMWDALTPIDEILRGFDDLVRQGKVLHAGLSDTPAWQASRMQAVAELRGWTPLVAMQLEYSLGERTPERELLPMAREMGFAVTAWAVLGGGLYTHAYSLARLREMSKMGRDESAAVADYALQRNLVERKLKIAEHVHEVAQELGKSPAQVAMAWAMTNAPGLIPLVGVQRLEELEDNLGALDVTFDPAQVERLNSVSAIELGFPHDMLNTPYSRAALFGELKVRKI
ncbi:MAG: aldo/keto reductase [Steroidobacteraceae bacterium]